MEYITTLCERNSGNKSRKKRKKEKKRKEKKRTEQNRTKKKVVRIHDLSLDDFWELIDINHVIHVMTYEWDLNARVKGELQMRTGVVKRNKVLRARIIIFPL